MTKFSLSRAAYKVVPESVELPDGRSVQVNADFRVILKCLRVLKNRDLSDAQKEKLVGHYFANAVGVRPFQMLDLFLTDEQKQEEAEEDAAMDFEQDADAIYASFMQAYGIDLIDIPFLHWNKFKALLAGLGGDTPLGRRVALREMDTSKMDAKQRAKVEKAKRRVALDADPMTDEEKQLHDALNAALAAGEDPAQAIRALKEHYNRLGGD